MAKKVVKKIKLHIPAGSAKPSPPIGPALGAAGLNIMLFCKEFNAKTQDRLGDLLPVEIFVYADKSFVFITKQPPVSSLILKELGVDKGSGVPNRDKIGCLTWDQVQRIVEVKKEDLRACSDEAAARVVVGTAKSMGVDVSCER